ncbi:hypothetical protein MXB_1282 [Myxobolus squamalis]|nr:hypothetical protein MXB_1282 [Myxobolus squamalis]
MLLREHKKCLAQEKTEITKVKQAMLKGDMDSSRVFAENAIRYKSQAISVLKMSSRIDAISQRVQISMSTSKLTSSVKSVVKSITNALSKMDLQMVSTLMDNFEKQYENMDIQSNVMQDSMGESISSSVPLEKVDLLLMQVAEENGLELKMEIPNAATNAPIKKAEEANPEMEVSSFFTSRMNS